MDTDINSRLHFDDVIARLGQFGKYQRRQYFLLCLPAIVCAFHQLSSVFLAATPDFRCQLPPGVFNGTDTYKIQNAEHRKAIIDYIKLKNNPDNSSGPLVYDSCFLKNQTDFCTRFVYSKEYLQSTIVTEWNLVCGDAYKSTLSTSVFMFGVMVGAFTLGILSDVIGRKKTILACLALQGATGLASAFVPNFYAFAVLRFFTGVTGMGLFMTAFVLGVELVGPKYRLLSGIVIEYFFALGYVLVTAVAYVTKTWSYMQIVHSVPSFLFLIYYWFINESARWLISKGRIEEAEKVIQNAAKVNEVELPEEILGSLEEEHSTKEKASAIFSAPHLLIRTLVVFFNWLVVSLGYYGLSLNSGSLGGDIFVNFMLGGLVEFPGYTACFLCNRIGRKLVYILGMLTCGLSCIASVLVDRYIEDSNPNKNAFIITLNMIGKFGITIGFCVAYFWSAEIFPTTIRNSMMGFSSTMARIGSIASPFIADLGKYAPPAYQEILAPAIFGSSVILGAGLSYLLPETTGVKLPETVHEADRFIRSKMRNSESVENLVDHQ